jgi:hypothetical protein
MRPEMLTWRTKRMCICAGPSISQVDAFPDIEPKDGQTVKVWGVVRSCTKRFIL